MLGQVTGRRHPAREGGRTLVSLEQPIATAESYQRLVAVFPELERIENEQLRRQVAAVWLRLWEMSGYEDIRDAFFMPYLPTRKLVEHTRSVTLSAIGIAHALAETQRIYCNMDRLIAASLLHDASKCVEFERRADGTYGRTELGKNYPHSYIVTEIARQVGVPDDVAHLVVEHSPTAPLVTRYVEGAVLHHADLVDSDCVNFVAGMLTDRVKKGLPDWLHQDVFE